MSYLPYADALEARVLSATPSELVTLLYDGAVEAIREGRKSLAAGNILMRSRAVTKAVNILIELNRTLDHKPAPQLTRNLERLYSFMVRTLLEANYRQEETGLITVENLLTDLQGAWMQIGSGSQSWSSHQEHLPTVSAGANRLWQA